jgi:sulfur-oxidizing protein SoxZ
MARVLIQLPSSARQGELIQVRTLIAHPMETGFRPGADGKVLARDIIRRFSCRYNGELVFSADLFPSVAANPYLTFHVLALASGTLSFTWEGDQGFTQTETASITVSG